MAEKRYFANGFVNRITYRTPNQFERLNPGASGQFFDTWAEAHAWLLDLRLHDLKAAEEQLLRAKGALRRCRAMKGAQR